MMESSPYILYSHLHPVLDDGMNAKKQHILAHFPKQCQQLTRLMADDPEFAAMCEDYDACVDALNYWGQSSAPEAQTRVEEYRTLVSEIEAEIKNAFKLLNVP